VELPFAPSVNRLWRMGRGKKMYKSKVYEDWIGVCRVLIYKGKHIPIMGHYQLTIEAVRPDKRRRDIDNLIKAVSDVLQDTGLIEDDCLCQEVTAKWVKEGPEMRVILEKIDVV
jgi:crossover junction endodeoxyribonuclease RusA